MKVKSTKRALLSAVMALVLCFSMLLGTTFAWFTDSVTSANNVITAGNLDIELYHADNGTSGADEKVTSATKLFDDVDSTLWEPGAMAWEKFTVANEGSLALKYELALNVRNATVIDGISFTSLLKVAIVDESFVYTRANVEAIAKDSWKALDSFTKNGELLPDESDVYGVIIWWQPSAEDNLFNMNNGAVGTVGVEIGATLMATQLSHESDSFNTSYDYGATFPMAAIDFVTTEPIDTSVISNTGELTEIVSLGEERNSIRAEVPAGVQLAQGVAALDLTVNTMSTSDANLTLNENEESLSLDVHIGGVDEHNTVPMKIFLQGVVKKGLNDNNIKLYHVEDGVTVPMTAVAYDALTGHNQFYYNAITGDITLSLASFSEVALVADGENHWDGKSATAFAGGTGTEADPYLIANASQLAYFRDVVDGGKTFEGEYVQLSGNIFLNHEAEFTNLFDPIGWGYSYKAHNRNGAEGKVFKGTFDGNHYSIHGLWQNGWDLEAKTGTDYTYTNCGGGLFAAVENATIKNLGMVDAIVTYECVEIGIVAGLVQGNCNFDTILIFDSKIANYQRPTGGVVGEVSPSRNADGTAIASTVTFEDIVLDTSVVVGSLWGDFDAPVGGVIGAYWDDDKATKVVMNNVKVACELDVYNDVTSTYQWYAYRRAGMLIGNTEQATTTNGRTVATADFLTCTNVMVYYTNWAKYNYCQFTNHNSSWPWVRVQAGENCDAYSNPRYGVPNDVNGNKVTGYDHVHEDGDQCNVQIYFNQLYGGGQGVYGQPAHTGVYTDVKYLITFLHDDHVASIRFIRDNSAVHTVEFPDTTKLPHLDQNKEYEWLDRNGETISAEHKNNTIPAGNVRDIFYYLTEANKYYAHFVDKDGFLVAEIEFDPDKGTLMGEAPAVPAVPGYRGIWEPYTLLGAEHDVIINAVYTKSDYSEILTVDNVGDLFDLLGRGHHLAMSQDLDANFSNASKDTFCTIVTTPDQGKDYTARLDMNSFTLQYNGDSSANKNWTLFKILGASGKNPASKFTVGDGFAGFGFLYFDLSKLNSNAKPTIFDLEEGATLVLERGVVIEFRYPKNNDNEITVFKGVGDISKYSGIEIKELTNDAENIVRITVNARTVMVGVATSN